MSHNLALSIDGYTDKNDQRSASQPLQRLDASELLGVDANGIPDVANTNSQASISLIGLTNLFELATNVVSGKLTEPCLLYTSDAADE